MIVRIFKTRALARFTKREAISDESLVVAIETARRGLIDADLGGGVIKQRVARPGQGKRGGFRMLIGFRSDRAIFLFGFAKNERENIDDKQLTTLREIVASWFAADDKKIAQALKDGLLIEVNHGKENKNEPSAD
ncbi:MAG TPA: type II toxin-antitoxin system RelE/ParE family toxin [Bradyrhizobium sp.]